MERLQEEQEKRHECETSLTGSKEKEDQSHQKKEREELQASSSKCHPLTPL